MRSALSQLCTTSQMSALHYAIMNLMNGAEFPCPLYLSFCQVAGNNLDARSLWNHVTGRAEVAASAHRAHVEAASVTTIARVEDVAVA
jgi:hypothetical protein